MEFPGTYTDGKILVKIPYESAMGLTTSSTKGQLYWTTENGNKQATKTISVPVEELIREVGYD